MTKQVSVVAATSYTGGEYVVCQDNALGPILARFPRTSDGYLAAKLWNLAYQSANDR